MDFQKYSEQPYDIIKQTRQIVNGMSKIERFKKAKRHLNDALKYRHPRNDIEQVQNKFFHLCYNIQVSQEWNLLLFFLSLAYMYLIIFEPNNHNDITFPFNQTAFIFDILILSILWLDVIMQVYHKLYWKVSHAKKFTNTFYYKIVSLTLFVIDDIVFYISYSSYPLRPFRMFRSFLPYFYDYFSRKAFISLISAYQDIIVFIILHTCIMIACGIIGTQIIKIPQGTPFDPYNQNYQHLPTMIYLMYVLSSYDAWPDYQQLAIQYSSWYYLFFVTFIFLNCFYFVTIPTNMYFSSFKAIRIKMLLIDEIKQENNLLLCFICLGESNLSIKSETFHQFMLFVYKNKLRYIEHIKELSFRLDKNNDGQIFISDFMKICNIMSTNSEMSPPAYQDKKLLMRLRKNINRRLHIKSIVKTDYFEIIILIIIKLNISLVLTDFFRPGYINQISTLNIFLGIYIVEIILRFIAEGPQKYVKSQINLLDLFIVLVNIFFQFIYFQPSISITLIRLVRLIRVARIVKIWSILFLKKVSIRIYLYKNTMYKKLRILISQLGISIVIGVRMFPIFMTAFYILGIIGLENYDNRYAPKSDSPYNAYDPYSNFRSFITSQLLIIQIMVEAGWSVIVYDTVYRYDSFAPVVLYFVFCHILIVIVLVSWMKGLVGDLYFTIKQKYEIIWTRECNQILQKQQQKKKRIEILEIKEMVQNNVAIRNDTIKKKQIYQNKLDRKLMRRLKEFINIRRDQKEKMKNTAKSIREMVMQRSFRKSKKSDVYPQLNLRQSISNNSLYVYEQVVIQDIQDFENELVDRIILKEEQLPYMESPIYPKNLIEFLKKKLKIYYQYQREKQVKQKFDINKDIIEKNGISFYTNQLESLLEIKKPEKQRKKQILEDILKLKITDREQIQKRLKKDRVYEETYTSESVLNQVYRSETNPDLIKKFQVQYFSDIYGESFRQLNRVALQPMLKIESFLIYTLMRLLRYEKMQTYDFFHILATIQIKISENLLKIGSIFKFVFEVQALANNWFSIEVTQTKEIKIHFLKSGIWIYHKGMKNQEIYYANDIFYQPEELEPENQFKSKQKVIRLLYNSFQTLAFAMLDQTNFFNSDPAENVYDLYSFYTNCDESKDQSLNSTKLTQQQRLTLKKATSISVDPFHITKVMIIVLSKQNERTSHNKLKYGLTNLTSILQKKKKKKTHKDFKFDDADDQTFEKLKNLAAQQHQKLITGQGLPYSYLIDMMKSIQDILNLYKRNLVKKVKKVLKQEFDKLD